MTLWKHQNRSGDLPGPNCLTWTTFQVCCETASDTHDHHEFMTHIASRPSRAIQLYSAIQRYTLYSYISLYTIQPLQHPSVLHLPLYRPCSASIPYFLVRLPALSERMSMKLASSLSLKQQIDWNLAVGSVGCVTTCRMSPCNDRTRTRRPCGGSSCLAPTR